MLRILHVDDSLDDYELTRMNLNRRAPDFELDWVGSAEEALEKLATDSFDCVLCDYQMPGFNGLELLKRMSSGGNKVPFIFFTGQGSEEIAAEALRIGAKDYFTKDIGFAFYDRIANSIRNVVESQRLLRERRILEERYTQLFGSLPVAVAVYEAVDDGEDFVFKDMNRAGEQMEGIKREEIIGRNVTEVFPGIKNFGLLDVFKRVFRGGIPEQHPISFYIDKRHSGWRKNYVYKLPTSEIVAIYEDVTVFQEAMERLQVSEEQLTLALEATRDGIWDWNIQTGEVFFSPSYMRMLGYEPNELPNRIETYENLLHPDDRQESATRLRELFASDENGAKIELRLRTKSGELKTVLARGRIVARDDEGKPLRMIGTHTDISDLKRAEEEIQRVREHISLVLHLIPHAVIITDSKGNIIQTNRAVEQMTGFKLTHVAARSIFDFIRPADHDTKEGSPHPIKAIMDLSEKRIEQFKAVITDSHGMEKEVSISAAPIPDHAGGISGMVIVLRVGKG
jgi:PAS domain S-box-containing protein